MTRPPTPKMAAALGLLGDAWQQTGSLTIDASQVDRYSDVPWINYTTARALERLGLVEVEKSDPTDGPDEVTLTGSGARLAEGCRQCGRSELDSWPDGQSVTLVGCDICGGPACDEHCALSEGEWCCTDHEPDAGWDPEPCTTCNDRGWVTNGGSLHDGSVERLPCPDCGTRHG